MLRRALPWLLFLLIAIGAGALFYEIYDDFRLSNVTWEGPVDPDWDVPPLTQTEEAFVQNLLSKPWTYLGKGHQSYAFKSGDGQYVLKFIKFTYLKDSPFQIPEEKKQDRLKRVFQGYKLAYERDRENNGLIALHKRQQGGTPQFVTLRDRWGWTHSIDVTPLYYIIQKKAVPTRDVLNALKAENNFAEIKRRLLQILDLYAVTYSKGLYDNDHNVLYNTGFVDDKPIRIDAGRLRSDMSMQNPAVFHADLQKIVEVRLQKWIATLPQEQQAPLMEVLQHKVQAIEHFEK